MQSSIVRLALVCTLGVLIWATAATAAPISYVLCRKTSDGAIAIRATRCRSGETKVNNISALTGPAGPAGAAGATGPAGPTGAAGSARGYGFVSSAGNVDTARSSANITARKFSTGVYCISAGGVTRGSVLPVVTADYRDGLGTVHIAQVDSNNFNCLATEWDVRTYREDAGAFIGQDLAFSFIIP